MRATVHSKAYQERLAAGYAYPLSGGWAQDHSERARVCHGHITTSLCTRRQEEE